MATSNNLWNSMTNTSRYGDCVIGLLPVLLYQRFIFVFGLLFNKQLYVSICSLTRINQQKQLSYSCIYLSLYLWSSLHLKDFRFLRWSFSPSWTSFYPISLLSRVGVRIRVGYIRFLVILVLRCRTRSGISVLWVGFEYF